MQDALRNGHPSSNTHHTVSCCCGRWLAQLRMERSSKQAGAFPPRAAGQHSRGPQGPATAVAPEGASREVWQWQSCGSRDFTELPWAGCTRGAVEGFGGACGAASLFLHMGWVQLVGAAGFLLFSLFPQQPLLKEPALAPRVTTSDTTAAEHPMPHSGTSTGSKAMPSLVGTHPSGRGAWAIVL